jgi:GDP-4-dehydro-6-deoxy-D-mannose reductase
MKILITGFSGFVSRHFIEYLNKEHIKAEICGIDIKEPKFMFDNYGNDISISFHKINLLDYSELYDAIEDFMPDYILHLASYSSVAYSWKFPEDSFKNNTNIFLNLIMSVKDINKDCRILSVGSSEEYGNVEEKDLPLTEKQLLNPISPYAVARVSQEMLSKLFVESYNMDIVMTRSFNHIGPYQDERFVVPSFIRRILNLYDIGAKNGTIETGDISIVRDFVDVRDVVRAYYTLLQKGRSGQIYNICGGVGISLKLIVDNISKYLDMDIKTKVNPDYVRPNDNKIIIGSAEKIANELGWKPCIRLEDTLKDMVEIMKSY